jgi:hypothetical protein
VLSGGEHEIPMEDGLLLDPGEQQVTVIHGPPAYRGPP